MLQKHGHRCGFVSDVINFEKSLPDPTPLTWANCMVSWFCGHQDIDPGGVFAEGQRAEEGWMFWEEQFC